MSEPVVTDARLSVDVIIAFHRADATFPDALASVLTQTRAPARIIVVDDGSPAGSARSLEALPPEVTLVRHRKNRGVGAARRTGSAEATAPLLAYLDADDRWSPDYLARMVAALERLPDAPAVYAAVERCWPDGRRTLFRDKPPSLDLREAIVRSHFIPTGAVIRRSALEAAGGWPEDRWVIDDWHLSIRLIDRCGPMVFVPEAVVSYAVGNPSSINSRDLKVLRRWVRSLRQLRSIVDREHGPGGARRRFAKALADRADRRRGVSRRGLHLLARLLGPPLS